MTCLSGACVTLPALLVSSKLDTFLTYSCLGSMVCAHVYGSETRSTSVNSGYRAWTYLSAANTLVALMFISAFYHNCSITTRDGVKIPLRDAFYNILQSPAWAEFRRTIQHLFHCLIHQGPYKFIYELRIVLDPEGENNAYRVSFCMYIV